MLEHLQHPPWLRLCQWYAYHSLGTTVLKHMTMIWWLIINGRQLPSKFIQSTNHNTKVFIQKNNAITAWPIRLFWAYTDVFHFSLPITDIFALLNPQLKDITSLQWRTIQHEIICKPGSLEQLTTTACTLICLQAFICIPHKNLRANVTS